MEEAIDAAPAAERAALARDLAASLDDAALGELAGTDEGRAALGALSAELANAPGGIVDAPAQQQRIDAALQAAQDLSLSDIGHGMLDGVGLVPVIGEAADLVNAGWYAIEGNWTDAALSAGAMIPVVGSAATATKWGKRAVDVAQAGADTARTLRRAEVPHLSGIPADVGMQRVAEVRAGLNVPPGRNVAVADAVIDGLRIEIPPTVSGRASPPGTVPSPEESSRRFTVRDSGAMSRGYDTEVKILEDLASRLRPDSTGTITLFSERAPCHSCRGVIDQFRQMFPDIRLIVTHGP